jgi:hypothetical protein
MRQLRNSILGLLVGTLLLIPTAVWGRDNLGTSGSEGIVTIKSIDKLGLRVGGEYGVMDNLALVADLGDHNYSRLGVKVLVTPNLFFLGGLRSSNIFLGADLRTALEDRITAIGTIDVYEDDSNLEADYEMEFEMDLTERLNAHLGLAGEIKDSQITSNLMLGVGYRF